jgi:hypothetical protein
VANLKKEEYRLYEKNLLEKWDAYSVLKTAKDRGIEKDKAEGKAEGKAQAKAEVVRNLINKFWFNDEQAASASEVSIDYGKQIPASLKKKK